MKTITHDRNFIYDRPVAVTWKYRVRRCLAPMLDLLYRTAVRFNRPAKSGEAKLYGVSACAIFRNEAPYLREWIEMNRIAGIEHFYLYNNFSDDNYLEVLRPYIDGGVVTLTEWPVEMGQLPSFEHFWKHFRSQTQWVTFIDLDEFYCPYYVGTLSEWLAGFKNQPSVVVYWKMFGSSGHLEHDPERPVTEQYTVSWDRMDSVGKVIANTDWEFTSVYQHQMNARCRFLGRSIAVPSSDEFGHYLRWPEVVRGASRRKEFTIQLNHYWSKAYRTYLQVKIARGVAIEGYDYRPEVFFVHERNNRAADYKIFRYMVQLKLALEDGGK